MSTEPTPAALPRNFMRPCVLLLLREQPAHGYELLERLKPFGFTRDDPGRLYRTLRALESEKLVRSGWESSQQGPHRRIYELTRRGMEQLHEDVKLLVGALDVLNAFLSRFEEFVAVDRASVTADTAR